MSSPRRDAEHRAARRILAVAALLLLTSPFVLLHRQPLSLSFSLPRVHSGDEPHYLLMLNSLMIDGDLDLGNNYASARQGSLQAGARYAGEPLDHQTVAENPRGEYSIHPDGLALLLAPLLYFLRDTGFVEPAAILCSTLATLAVMGLSYQILLGFACGPRRAAWAAALIVLGTPLWHYANTFFTEPYLALCAVAACAFTVRWPRPIAAGLFVGAGALMKPPFAIVVIPLALFWWSSGRRLATLSMLAPVAAAAGVILASNAVHYGSPLTGPQAFEAANPLVGAAGLLFSLKHGVLLFAPVALLAARAWPALLARRRPEARVVLGVAIAYFVLMATWKVWWGGHCYGPRLIMPILPLFLLPLGVYEKPTSRRAALASALLIGLSLWVSAIAALARQEVWSQHAMYRYRPVGGWLL